LAVNRKLFRARNLDTFKVAFCLEVGEMEDTHCCSSDCFREDSVKISAPISTKTKEIQKPLHGAISRQHAFNKPLLSWSICLYNNNILFLWSLRVETVLQAEIEPMVNR